MSQREREVEQHDLRRFRTVRLCTRASGARTLTVRMDFDAMGRIGTPDDIAHTIVWLASEEESPYVTGALIDARGGR